MKQLLSFFIVGILSVISIPAAASLPDSAIALSWRGPGEGGGDHNGRGGGDRRGWGGHDRHDHRGDGWGHRGGRWWGSGGSYYPQNYYGSTYVYTPKNYCQPPVFTLQVSATNLTRGQAATFYVTAKGASPLTILWTVDGSNSWVSASSSFSFTPSHLGLNIVTIVVRDGNGLYSAPQNVQINAQ